jgi:hypothetical protein
MASVGDTKQIASEFAANSKERAFGEFQSLKKVFSAW